MVKRRGSNSRRKNPGPKMTKRNVIGKMVNGSMPLTYPEKLLAAGAPYAQVVTALCKTAGMFAGMINSEVHYKDTAATSLTIDNAGTVQYLSGIPIGDTDITRTGSSILAKDLSYRLSIRRVTGDTFVRMIIVCDKQCDGALLTPSQILQSLIYDSSLNQDYSKRFVVLKDKTWAISAVATPVIQFKDFISLPFHLKYDGVSAAIGDAKENQIYAFFISNHPPVTAPQLDCYFRFKYHDN